MSVWVGDLAPEVDDLTLLSFFQQHYRSVRSARVVLDNTTMQSRGYGFVRFMDEIEFQRAISEMNGQVLMGRCIKIALGSSGKRTSSAAPVPVVVAATPTAMATATNAPKSEPRNVLFITGLPLDAKQIVLKNHFSKFGCVLQVELLEPPTSLTTTMLSALVTFDSHIPVGFLLGKEGGCYSYDNRVMCQLAPGPKSKSMTEISTHVADSCEEADQYYFAPFYYSF